MTDLPDKSSCAHVEYIRTCGDCPWVEMHPLVERPDCGHHETTTTLLVDPEKAPPAACPIRGGVALIVVKTDEGNGRNHHSP